MHDGEWTESHARDEYVSDAGIIGFRGVSIPENCQWKNHMTAQAIKKKVGGDLWDRYFKFCVIRNPYDKVLSAFYYFYYLNPQNRLEPVKDLSQRQRLFESWLEESYGSLIDRDRYTIDGEFALDTVIRFEQLQADLELLCVRLGVRWESWRLPKFKAGARPLDAQSNEMIFTPRSRKIVNTIFDYEFTVFGYPKIA